MVVDVTTDRDLIAESSGETRYSTAIVARPDRRGEVDRVLASHWNDVEKLRREHPELLMPTIEIHDAKLLGHLRGDMVPLTSAVPLGYTDAFGDGLGQLDDVRVLLRHAPDRTVVATLLSLYRATVTLGILQRFHASRDADQLERLESDGRQVLPSFEIPIPVSEEELGVWDALVRTRGWLAITAVGESSADRASALISGDRVAIEI